ncbi:hypothetical protein TNCV_4570071 [Trichonephila clavipes]|nr:hypothetical protein TNCV_4570071 [Trichonephila clavipes]
MDRQTRCRYSPSCSNFQNEEVIAVAETYSWSPLSCNFAYLQIFVNRNGLHQTIEYAFAIHYPLPSGKEIVLQKIHVFLGQQVATAAHELSSTDNNITCSIGFYAPCC